VVGTHDRRDPFCGSVARCRATCAVKTSRNVGRRRTAWGGKPPELVAAKSMRTARDHKVSLISLYFPPGCFQSFSPPLFWGNCSDPLPRERLAHTIDESAVFSGVNEQGGERN
jgi:hypothetical protein